jgi:hypothetical protein
VSANLTVFFFRVSDLRRGFGSFFIVQHAGIEAMIG